MAQAITSANFDEEVLNSSDVVLVDFWAPWCGPCQMLLPIVEKLADEIGDGAKIVKINVDEEQELAQKYGVMSIPAIKVFKGGKMVEEAVGAQSEEKLRDMIDSHRSS